jgi:hypothetical protein
MSTNQQLTSLLSRSILNRFRSGPINQSLINKSNTTIQLSSVPIQLQLQQQQPTIPPLLIPKPWIGKPQPSDSLWDIEYDEFQRLSMWCPLLGKSTSGRTALEKFIQEWKSNILVPMSSWTMDSMMMIFEACSTSTQELLALHLMLSNLVDATHRSSRRVDSETGMLIELSTLPLHLEASVYNDGVVYTHDESLFSTILLSTGKTTPQKQFSRYRFRLSLPTEFGSTVEYPKSAKLNTRTLRFFGETPPPLTNNTTTTNKKSSPSPKLILLYHVNREDGVVGERPELKRGGEVFEYCSHTGAWDELHSVEGSFEFTLAFDRGSSNTPATTSTTTSNEPITLRKKRDIAFSAARFIH